MKKYKLLSISNVNGNINYYVIKNVKDLNVPLCKLMKDLNLDEESIAIFDNVFDEMDENYCYAFNKNFKVHLFVTKKALHLVIDGGNQKELSKKVNKYFSF